MEVLLASGPVINSVFRFDGDPSARLFRNARLAWANALAAMGVEEDDAFLSCLRSSHHWSCRRISSTLPLTSTSPLMIHLYVAVEDRHRTMRIASMRRLSSNNCTLDFSSSTSPGFSTKRITRNLKACFQAGTECIIYP